LEETKKTLGMKKRKVERRKETQGMKGSVKI
jgi:hypothetical protein